MGGLRWCFGPSRFEFGNGLVNRTCNNIDILLLYNFAEKSRLLIPLPAIFCNWLAEFEFTLDSP